MVASTTTSSIKTMTIRISTTTMVAIAIKMKMITTIQTRIDLIITTTMEEAMATTTPVHILINPTRTTIISMIMDIRTMIKATLDSSIMTTIARQVTMEMVVIKQRDILIRMLRPRVHQKRKSSNRFLRSKKLISNNHK